MSRNSWLTLGFAFALVGAVATAALAGDDMSNGGGAKTPRATPSHQKNPRAKTPPAAARGKMRPTPQERTRQASDFIATLAPTDEQRQLLVEKARAAATIVKSAQEETRRIVNASLAATTKDGSKPDRKAARAAVKQKLVQVRDHARSQLEPLARDVVASLTPEQRTKLQSTAGKRGKSVNDAQLVRLAAIAISRPAAVKLLEAPPAK
jgi:Spy/CpxP family protein refolding chaperone